ncbi:MAG: recQ [Gammaproteobacteria bacterium]|jgi:ATP-dependent DNA helicase RecQ|nr:recQ [Gammaproteobacteria bacterium]
MNIPESFPRFNSAQEALDKIFGYEHFRPGQQEIIESLLAGQDNFVLMPTGGGKSLCFQIPALLRPGTGIVISPLISLMQDQVTTLRANGVAAAYYNSTLSGDEARKVLAQLHQGQLDLLYVSPERLLSASFMQRLHEIEIALFAIDEAHCISQWGHDFRPEYTQLNRLIEEFPAVPIIALTATADKQTRQDILQRLRLREARVHIASFDRPNIRYTIVEKYKPLQQLTAFLKSHPQEAGIIYCQSRKKVEEIAAKLAQMGFTALPYHAGLANTERGYAQTAFQKDDIQLIVATIAFGMGIDKPNVRFVIHYDLPKHIESYYQETGRAGRDGLSAEALLLYGTDAIATSRHFIEQLESPEQKRIELSKLNAMAALAEAQTCRRQVLLTYFGERLEQPCDNCDICLNPPETYDATEDARKALSCVYRVNQRFGLGHIVDVLRGANKQRILDLGHERLSTYGIGKQLSEQTWFSIFRQLIHLGYLEQDIANYSVLKLTEHARPLLRGEITLKLAKPRIQTATKHQKKATGREVRDDQYDQKLFAKLRQLRKQLADAAMVPPFVIFSDATLIEMSTYLPRNSHELLSITGVGERKLANYGEQFLQAIKNHLTEIDFDTDF